MKSRLSGSWVSVPEEEARQNRYYGLGGWLLFFYLLTLLTMLQSLVVVLNPGDPSKLALFGNDVTTVRIVHIVFFVVWLPFAILAPLKHARAPAAWIAGYWISFAAMAAALDAPTARVPEPVLIGISLLGTLLMSWYAIASKRVNVTFRHRVPAAQAAMAGAVALPPRKPLWRRWTTYVVRIPLITVTVILAGLYIIGSYQTVKRGLGNPVAVGRAISGSSGVYTVTPPVEGWVRAKRGAIAKGADLELYGPTAQTWAVVYTLKASDASMDGVVNARRDIITRSAGKATVAEQRMLLRNEFVPVSYARYKQVHPGIPPGTTWWVATIAGDADVVEVIAGTTDRKQLSAIKAFVDSARLAKKVPQP